MDTNRWVFTPVWDSNVHKLDTLGLLQKSVEFKVVNRGDQVEAQRKSRSPITIPLTQDTKHFQLAKNMLNHNPLSSQRTITLLFLLGQRMIFGFLDLAGLRARRFSAFWGLIENIPGGIMLNTVSEKFHS
jgi:hypothetical protein